MLKSQIASKTQPFKEQLYRLGIELVRLVNKRLIRSVFVPNQRGLFQVSSSVSCDSFSVANSFEARFLDMLVRWIHVRESTNSNPAIIYVVQTWGAGFPTYKDDALLLNHRYENVVASLLELAIDAKGMSVLI